MDKQHNHRARGSWTARAMMAVTLIVALVAGSMTVVATPAQAITWLPKLCSGFSQCTSQGRGNHGYQDVYKQPFWNMYGGHNCTNYAAYRLQKNGVAQFTTPGQGNATNWGSQARAKGIAVDKQNPQVGDIAWWTTSLVGSTGHVAYVESVDLAAGTFVASEDNFGGDFDWRTYYISEVSGFIHVGQGPTDGSFVSYQGHVYRLAGGAPIHVSSWANVGGVQPTTKLTDQQWAKLRHHPADGTFVKAGIHVYRFAGGAPIHVSSWASVGGSKPTITVDPHALNNPTATGVGSHVRKYPADGTFVKAGPHVFRFAGGAPIHVSNWASVGGSKPTTTVDPHALNHPTTTGPGSHVRKYPADGTFVKAGPYVYRFAGGAPLYVSSWANVGGSQPTTTVDPHALNNPTTTGVGSHVRKYPADGTFLRGATTGKVYRVVGGKAFYVNGCASIGSNACTTARTAVDQAAIDNAGRSAPWSHLLATPLNGTVVKSMPSGVHYRWSGGKCASSGTVSGALVVNDPSVAAGCKS